MFHLTQYLGLQCLNKTKNNFQIYWNMIEIPLTDEY